MVDGALARRFGGYRDGSVDDNVAGAVVVVGVDRGTEHTHLTGFNACAMIYYRKVRRRRTRVA